MESLLRSLNYDLYFDKDAQHILENSHSLASPPTTSANAIALSSMPTITSLDSVNHHQSLENPSTTSEFLQKLGATFINSIHLQTSPLSLSSAAAQHPVDAIATDQYKNMDFALSPPHIVISNDYDTAMGELQKQVEYDKFMNEVWIGIVLTLILISMVFCFCSCFLYHQFRVWKRNYRTTLTQNNEADNLKISMDMEDPVPEYTLVSGLPSYEAALELLHKNPTSCLIVHPSVFEIFNRNEKHTNEQTTIANNNSDSLDANHLPLESTTPLLNECPPSTPKAQQVFIAPLPSYHEATANVALSLNPLMPYNHSYCSLSMVNEKSQMKTSSLSSSSSPPISPNSLSSSTSLTALSSLSYGLSAEKTLVVPSSTNEKTQKS